MVSAPHAPQPERTRQEDRRSKFYEIPDNLTEPDDAAKPVLVAVTDSDGATDGLIEAADSLTFSFSDQGLDDPDRAEDHRAAARLRQRDLTIPSILSTVMSMGSTGCINAASKSAVFAGSTSSTGRRVDGQGDRRRVLVRLHHAAAPATAPTMSIKPAMTLTDAAGHTAATTAHGLSSVKVF